MKATFIQATTSEDKSVALRSAARGVPTSKLQVGLDPEDFRIIGRSPFAYWISARVRGLFATLPRFGDVCGDARQGMATSDDFRFVRVWSELPSGILAVDWSLFPKGGEFSPFFGDIPLVVRWGTRSLAGGELKAFAETTSGTTHWSRHIKNVSYYLTPGLTYPRRLHRLSVMPLPAGSTISVRGSGIFSTEIPLGQLAGLLSSSAFDFLCKCLLGRFSHPQFDNGTIAMTPVPREFFERGRGLEKLTYQGISVKRGVFTTYESSRQFLVPALLQFDGDTFDHRVSAWAERVAGVEAELVRVQSEIDELCFELYGISEEDRRAITEGFGVTDTNDDSDDDADEDESDAGVELDPVGLAAGLVSWAVGVAAGRFDVRLATGERDWPMEPDPFDPLPVCSPGMLTGADGLPATSLPDGYPLVPSPVLVDDPGHELDMTARVRAVFDVVFGDDADTWWSDIGAALDTRNGVEGWLRRGFFDHHLKTYSKSRRKALIMWPIGTKSGSYQVWLYAHSVTPDTVFRLLGDVIEPKLAAEQRQLSDLTQEFGPNPTASQRRSLDIQQRFVDEITGLRDEIRAVAALWHPDLNDGIVIVLAPLWRLFTQHRAWAKELKDRWVKLAKGDYDWAQLAMHIWPERVIPKCATDRSLAIAHDLENIFWAQDDTNPDKWHPRTTPTTPTEQLISDQTNPTITTTRNHPNP